MKIIEVFFIFIFTSWNSDLFNSMVYRLKEGRLVLTISYIVLFLYACVFYFAFNPINFRLVHSEVDEHRAGKEQVRNR